MAARGHIRPNFEGRPAQAPGMMRHGSLPGLGPAGHLPLEPLPPPELLENKMAVQTAEIERLARDNHRLAATHVALRQELVAAQQDMQRLQAHIRSIQTESDIQIRVLLEKIAKMDADIQVGESVKKDLKQAHMEAQSLLTARQELTAQIEKASQEVQKVHADVKKLPEMHAELDSLRQEHQRLRAAFEYEKGLNMEQVEQMHAMEKNLVAMAREVEKLRVEVLNAEKRSHGPNPYATSTYGNPDPSYLPAVQGSGYFVDGYGRQVQMGVGAVGGGMHAYGKSSGSITGGGSGVGSSAAAAASGGVAVGRGGGVAVTNSGVVRGGSYDASRGAPAAL